MCGTYSLFRFPCDIRLVGLTVTLVLPYEEGGDVDNGHYNEESEYIKSIESVWVIAQLYNVTNECNETYLQVQYTGVKVCHVHVYNQYYTNELELEI